MRAYIIKRLLFFIPMFFIVSFCVFALIYLSSDNPALVVLEAQGVPGITEELMEMINVEYGFNDPFLVRYFNWLKDVIHLDFGKSFITGQKVSKKIMTAFGYTLQLTLFTTFITIIFSLVLGIFCVIWQGRAFDNITRMLMFVISAVPSYLVGIFLIWLFSVKFKILPTSGVGSIKHFILPSFVLSIGYFGFYFRMIRNSMLDNINENYVNFFRANGVKESRITAHILKNSLQTVIVAFSMAIPGLITGTVVIESIFSWPGLGRLCVSAIFRRDIPIIQAYVVLIAMFYLIFNILADIVNVAINPRLRKV